MSETRRRYFAIVRNPETGLWEDSGLPGDVLEALAGEIAAEEEDKEGGGEGTEDEEESEGE